MLERQVSLTDAALVVAVDSLAQTIERMGFAPDVHLFEEGVRRNSKDVPENVPTSDTASRDLAFIVSTGGVGGTRKDVAHTHGSVFATRVQAEHWLDVGRGDAVWCTAESSSAATMWNTVIGPWSRGAEVVLQQGQFDADERLDLLFRLGPSILCQSPAEYLALAEHPQARALPLAAAAPARLHGRLPRPRGRGDVRGALGHDRSTTATGRRRRTSSSRTSRTARRSPGRSGARFPATTSGSSTTRATSCRRASRATSPSAADRPPSSPATGSYPRRRRPRSSATGT